MAKHHVAYAAPGFAAHACGRISYTKHRSMPTLSISDDNGRLIG